MEQLHAKGFTRTRDTRKRVGWPAFRMIVFERPPVKLLLLNREGDWTLEMSLEGWEISEHVRFPLNVLPDGPPPAEADSEAQAR
jgi:hypothetical protein